MSEQIPEKKYSVEEIRTKHANAYRPWTGEEDEKFEILRLQGKTVKELGEIFGRQKGAISSRLRKMGLQKLRKP